ncbi:unnamed protein product [Camellia sinensis]
MKRQRNNTGGNGPAVATKRKAKREVKKVAEERRGGGECVEVEVEAEERRDRVDQRPQLWSVADEQMSWGSFWCPSWDMECLGEAYNALYSDVVWDDDIWDLKGIKEVPNQ